jgi:NADH-ubiquinone oxidoreductase chain 1
MTEHAAVIFVFFFLAEYASIVLICVLISILFIGGYLYNYLPFLEFFFTIYEYIYQHTDFDSYVEYINNNNILLSNPLIEGLVYGLVLGLKACIMIFIFI